MLQGAVWALPSMPLEAVLLVLAGVALALLLQHVLGGPASPEPRHFGCGLGELEQGLDPGRFCRETHLVRWESAALRVLEVRLAPGQVTPVHRLRDAVVAALGPGRLALRALHLPRGGRRALEGGEVFRLEGGVYRLGNAGRAPLALLLIEMA